jgi:putative transposase
MYASRSGNTNVNKAYKYRLYPQKTTEKKLYFVLNRCRELYNAALSERKDAYQYAGLSISWLDQKRDLPAIKQEIRPEYQQIGSHVLQDVLHRLNKAFDNFFRRVQLKKAGLLTGHVGYPRFQGRARFDSFTYPDGAGWKVTVEEQGKKLKGTLHLTKIGDIPITLHRPLEGKIKTVTVKREVDEWFVCFSCEVPALEKLPVSSEDVGIDLGVTHLATLSNGEMVEHPRNYRKAKKTLQRRQFEDLQIGNLTKKPKPKQDENGNYLPNGKASKSGLNKSILDAGWGAFVQLCTYKAAWAGRTLVKVDPKFTSQICSGCGSVVKKDLSERWHTCGCGTELDRDVNAAINILRRGHQHLGGKHPTSATA